MQALTLFQSHFKQHKWIRHACACVLGAIVLAGVYGLFSTYLFPFGRASSKPKLIDSLICGNFKLLKYQDKQGNGYVHLVDGQKKVLDSASFSENTQLEPIEWDADCRAVAVGSDEGRITLDGEN